MSRYKFILRHLGQGTQVIDEPVGWSESGFNLDRQESHDVIFSYTSKLGFYGISGARRGGMTFLQSIIGLYGVDTEVQMDLYIAYTIDNSFEYQDTWTLNLEDHEVMYDEELGDILYCPAERKGIQARFDKRYDVTIDLSSDKNLDEGSLNPYPERSLTMHSRAISKGFEGRFEEDSIFYGGLVMSTPETRLVSATIGWPIVTDEISDTFTLSTGFLSSQQRVDFIDAKEEGDFAIDINIEATLRIDRIIGDFDTVIWQWIFQKNDEPATILGQRNDTNVAQYEESLSGSLSTTVSLNIGDRLYLYGNIEVGDINGNVLGLYQFVPEIKYKAGSFITVSGVTTIPENVVSVRMIHDAFAKVCDAITGQNNSFYSEYLGHTTETSRTYSQDGEFSPYVVTNGAKLRGLNERSMSVDFKTLYDSLNAITPIGIGTDVINGKEVIRLEHISHFYNLETSINLAKVKSASISVDKASYYKSIEIGYTKGLPEEVGGLNEPNVKREYATALNLVGEKLSLLSRFIASSSIIEQQRREDADSKDTRYDNDIFIISLNRSDFTRAERNENYSLVQNLENPESAYNLRLSPAMNLLRQGPVINGGLIKKTGSFYKPTTNEGNFQMTTTASHTDSGNYNQQPLGENADIPWNYAALPEVSPLLRPFRIKFTHPLSFENFLLLKSSEGRKKTISFDVNGVTYLGWISKIEYNEGEDSDASFELIQANDVPVELLDDQIQLLILQSGVPLLLDDETKGVKLN